MKQNLLQTGPSLQNRIYQSQSKINLPVFQDSEFRENKYFNNIKHQFNVNSSQKNKVQVDLQLENELKNEKQKKSNIKLNDVYFLNNNFDLKYESIGKKQKNEKNDQLENLRNMDLQWKNFELSQKYADQKCNQRSLSSFQITKSTYHQKFKIIRCEEQNTKSTQNLMDLDILLKGQQSQAQVKNQDLYSYMDLKFKSIRPTPVQQEKLNQQTILPKQVQFDSFNLQDKFHFEQLHQTNNDNGSNIQKFNLLTKNAINQQQGSNELQQSNLQNSFLKNNNKFDYNYQDNNNSIQKISNQFEQDNMNFQKQDESRLQNSQNQRLLANQSFFLNQSSSKDSKLQQGLQNQFYQQTSHQQINNEQDFGSSQQQQKNNDLKYENTNQDSISKYNNSLFELESKQQKSLNTESLHKNDQSQSQEQIENKDIKTQILKQFQEKQNQYSKRLSYLNNLETTNLNIISEVELNEISHNQLNHYNDQNNNEDMESNQSEASEKTQKVELKQDIIFQTEMFPSSKQDFELIQMPSAGTIINFSQPVAPELSQSHRINRSDLQESIRSDFNNVSNQDIYDKQHQLSQVQQNSQIVGIMNKVKKIKQNDQQDFKKSLQIVQDHDQEYLLKVKEINQQKIKLNHQVSEIVNKVHSKEAQSKTQENSLLN